MIPASQFPKIVALMRSPVSFNSALVATADLAEQSAAMLTLAGEPTTLMDVESLSHSLNRFVVKLINGRRFSVTFADPCTLHVEAANV